ncbi:MAG: type II secretion system F family protein [Actinomycetota bacterium]
MMQIVSMLLIGGGIVLGFYGYSRHLADHNSALQELLESELEQPTKSPQDISELMEKAGAFAERAMGQSPAAGKVRFRLIQSGSSLRAGEFGAMTGMAAVVGGLLAFVLTGSLWVGLAALILIPVFALSRLKSKAAKRVALLESQLPEALQLIAGSLDSGTSLLLGMELAGSEGDAPLADELARVVAESAVGRPMLEALDAMANRIGSKDIAWTVKAIRIQHQTGGRLADTLRILADFMHARQEVRGEVRALSAEARISGKVLILMPITIAGFLYMTRREYVEPLFTTGAGNVMLGAACIGLVLGHVSMKKLGKVEV